jgi:hypothetical protein
MNTSKPGRIVVSSHFLTVGTGRGNRTGCGAMPSSTPVPMPSNGHAGTPVPLKPIVVVAGCVHCSTKENFKMSQNNQNQNPGQQSQNPNQKPGQQQGGGQKPGQQGQNPGQQNPNR